MRLFVIGVWLAVLAPGAGAALPWLQVRLETDVTSLKPGADVRARVVSPYVSGQGLLVPAGSLVSGRTESEDRRKLRLHFSTLRVSNTEYPIRARVAMVDNAREEVSQDGVIRALDPVRKRPGKLEAVLLLAAHAHPATLALVEGTKLALHEVERPAVRYQAGTDLGLAFEVPPPVPAQALLAVPAPPAELVSALRSLPVRTRTAHSQVPADWVNIVFAASREQLASAFASAGWRSADHLSTTADTKLFLALVAHHAYQSAPVSRQVWEGRGPDLVFQKQTNTIAKRHHIRIWQTGETWGGRPLWIAAATHDIGIEFSAATRLLTHRIDGEIDLERNKVADDLQFAGAVQHRNLVSRPEVPTEGHNATGDAVRTDGGVVFLGIGEKAV